MPRDPRTIGNTSKDEVNAIFAAAEYRKEKKWKKPKLCKAPECKTLFTPRREWQLYCSEGCRVTVQRENEARAKLRPVVLLSEALREIEVLNADIARLKARIMELEGK